MVASAPESHRMTRLGEYTIVRVIGEGGMGIVYEAVERLSQRRVALKVMHSNVSRLPGARERFFNEMRISASMEHPNIVRSLACTEIEGKLVIVLEYLEGQTLREELARTGRVPWERALVIASAVAAALVEAHGRAQPIVHRDLKPENLMLLSNGGVKVMDFGVAKVMTRDGKSNTTEAIGTVLYMSPEQAEGGEITSATDVYALGVVLYEMLTGVVPFNGPSIMATLRMQCEMPPPPFSQELRRTLPPNLESLVFWLLEKAPARRPASARVVLEKLQELQQYYATGPVGPRRSIPSAYAATSPVSPSDPSLSGGPGALPDAVQRQVLRPTGVAPAHAQGKALDTFQLLSGFESRRRWPWILAATFVALSGGALGAWLLFFRVLPSSPKPRRNPTIASVQPPAPGDSARATAAAPTRPSCSADVCAPFKPADPTSVEAETIIGEATKLAQSVDPQSRLSYADISGDVIVNGRVDVTRKRAQISFTYTGAVTAVDLEDGQLALRKNREDFSNRDPLPPVCTLQQAWDAALAQGAQFGTHVNATLTRPYWDISDRALQSEAEVDSRTCVVKSVQAPRKHDP